MGIFLPLSEKLQPLQSRNMFMKKKAIGLLSLILVTTANTKPEKNDWIFLHQAAKNGLIADLKKALKNKHDVNAIGYGHTTALHCAASNGHTTCLSILLQNNADATIKNIKGQIPLHCAAAQGNISCIEKLLAYNPDSVHATDNHGWTALHYAAAFSTIPCIKTLLAHGAVFNTGDEYCQTPEDIAQKKERRYVVYYLQQARKRQEEKEREKEEKEEAKMNMDIAAFMNININ